MPRGRTIGAVVEPSSSTRHSGPPADPISVDDVLAGRELTEPRLSPDGHRVAFVASAAGESHLYVIPVAGGPERRISPWPVRAGRGLGGGCFDWLPDSSGVVVVARTGELWSLSLDSDDAYRLVTPEPGKSLAAPCVSPDGDGIVMSHDQAQVFVYRLDGTVVRADRGDHDFVADPCWWNGRPVWQAWRVPDMPWDESRLVGVDGDRVTEFGGAPGVQIQQPRTDATCSRLGWVDDSTGWLNVTVVDGATGSIRRANESFEHASPSWGEGQRSWCFNDDGTVVAFTRNERGFGRLCTLDLDTGVITDRAKAVHGQLSWVGDTLVALRTGGKTPTQIVVYDTSGADWTRRTLVLGTPVDWDGHRALVEPELLEVAARDGHPLHARLYRAPGPNGRLLCWVHGGPTDQWPVTFMPRLNYWIDRGYDVLVPDYRGSTGFGRDHTQQLRGRWADLDVNDVADVLRHVGRDARRVALIGSSAGGLNVLGVAARYPHIAAAVVTAYPVTDIAALDATTHRFEAHYNRSLVGDDRSTAIASLERSPVNNVGKLTNTPILVMHGTADPVVSIEQSREFARVLSQAGGAVELVEFDGEGHGFRQSDNKSREYRLTETFLDSHLG